MRLQVLTRGAPGCGKSTFLMDNGLSEFVISPDMIRADIGGIDYDQDGNPQIGYFREDEVWREVKSLIRERMEKDRPVILDATFQTPNHISMPLKVAAQFGYETIFIDFSNVAKETSLRQNALRRGWEKVPDSVVLRAYENLNKYRIRKNSKVTSFSPDEFLRSQYFADLFGLR
ncbi:MAG: AAA family ATPase [Rhizobiaceae bacterium]